MKKYETTDNVFSIEVEIPASLIPRDGVVVVEVEVLPMDPEKTSDEAYAFTKQPVYSIILNALGDKAFRTDLYQLRQVEVSSDVLLTVEGEIQQPLEFFEKHKDAFLFIQGGCRIMSFDNLKKDTVFYGVVNTKKGFELTTGHKKEHFYCRGCRKQTVPVWVYNPQH